MPIINVSMIAGRAPEKRAELGRALTEAAVQVLGVDQHTVRVVITEIPAENWLIAGRSKAELNAEKGTQP